MKFNKLHGLKLSKCGVAILLILALGYPASAIQNATTGSIFGVVRDSTGALIPGAAVLFLSTTSEMAWSTRTNESGQFTRSGLPAGSYDVVTLLLGFRPNIIRGFKLGVAEAVGIRVVMRVSGETLTDLDVLVTANPTGTTDICLTDNSPRGWISVGGNCSFATSLARATRPDEVAPAIDFGPQSPLISVPTFEYPLAARANKFEGTLLFLADIGSDGRIRHLEAASDTSPNTDLKDFSLSVIRKWKFKPAERFITIQMIYSITR